MKRPRMLRTLRTLTLLLALGGVGAAIVPGRIGAQPPPPSPPGAEQAAPPTKGVVMKGKAPVSEEILRVKLPRPQEADLANGLHLMVLEDRRVPQITFQLLIPGAGGYYDPDDSPGLASFTAAMLREGTGTRTSLQISEQLETLAATLNAYAEMSSLEATLAGSCLTEHVERVLDLTADILLNASFPEDELARYKQRTHGQLAQLRANPNFLAGEMFARVLYGSHPGARVSPNVEALDKVTRDRLVDFHHARYVPDHAVVAMAGDISMAEARKLVDAKLGAWKKAGVPAAAVSDPSPLAGIKVHLVARPGSVQTNFIVGTQAIERTNPEYDAVNVMNRVIGGGPTGRLFVILREEKGYTYGAGSSVAAGHYRGHWQASTSVRTEVTEPALRDLLAEIGRLRDEPVSEKELRDVKRSMVAVFALSLESPQALLNYQITRRRYQLPADYWDRYPERVTAVTAQQVQAAARKYLDGSRLQIVAVGDATKVTAILKRHGTLITYDTQGRQIGSS